MTVAMNATATATLAVDVLHANAWNPNEMTAEEFTELVAEVRHLGRLPKPVVVRQNAAGYEIVDGEHGWRAAKECGFAQIACEVIEADDFEAMRQTYKRNQHGRHEKVKEGRMFRQMLDARGVSQRELAKELDLSEGTVRNALEYAAAAKVRNGYADDIAKLGVRQVRYLNLLPPKVGELWLKMGADSDALFLDKETADHAEKFNEEKDLRNWVRKEYGIWEDSGFIDMAARMSGKWHQNFAGMMKTLRAWWQFQRKYCYYGLKSADLLGYTRHYFTGNFYVRDDSMMSTVLRLIVDANTKPPTFLLTAGEFESLLEEQRSTGASHVDFCTRLEVEIWKKTGVRPPKGRGSIEVELQELELRDAPQWIRASALPTESKHFIWKFECDEDVKRDAAAEKLGEKIYPLELAPRMSKEQQRRRAARALADASKEDLVLAVAKCINDRLKLRDLPQPPEEIHSRFDRFAKLDKVDLVAIRDALEGTNHLELWAAIARGFREGGGIKT